MRFIAIKKWILSHQWRDLLAFFLGMAILAFSLDYFRSYWQMTPWISASLAASAFIVFLEPDSQNARAWPMVGGNIIAGLVAITLMHLPEMGVWAVPVTVTAAAVMMSLFRAFHPPACAVALLVVVRHITDYRFVFFPLACGTVIIMSCAYLYDRFVRKPRPAGPDA